MSRIPATAVDVLKTGTFTVTNRLAAFQPKISDETKMILDI